MTDHVTIDRLIRERNEARENERALSDAYVRLRVILGAMDPPRTQPAAALWAYVEDIARQRLRAALAQQAPQAEPVAYWIPKAEQFCIAKPGQRPFAKAWQPLYATPQAQPAAVPLHAPQSCPTHETSSGDHVICRRCGEVWPAGAERACVRAEKLLTRAHGITPQEAPAPLTDAMLRKLGSKRAIFQAGRDSYETAAVPMNTDDEAWEAYCKAHGITPQEGA